MGVLISGARSRSLPYLGATGLSILLVEQDAQAAPRIADRGYGMQRAQVMLSGVVAAVRADSAVRDIFLAPLQLPP